MKRHQPSMASCNGCGIAEDHSLLLHNVRYRANHRRFCTDCVLKNHQGLFCPICFDVYDDSPPPHLRLICLKCPSIAHRTCVAAASNSDSPTPIFQCPPCADPKFCYFRLNKENPSVPEANNANGDGNSAAVSVQNGQNSRTMDKESAKVLVAAAQIAAASMSKAAAAARIDAERRGKEASLAWKKAREALEHLAYLVAKDQEGKDDKEVSAEQRALLSKFSASTI